MKVVINACFGGFGISPAGIQWLRDRKSIWVTAQSRQEYFSNDTPNQSQEIHIKTCNLLADDSTVWYVDSDTKRLPGFRSDPDILGVVEALGEKANGKDAQLRIIEIPDDVEWHIEEYDGLEHVAENHRTWS